MVDTDRISGAARELGGMAQGTAENLYGHQLRAEAAVQPHPA
jgi:hypothetical protein